MDQRKKEMERFFLNRFKELFPEFPLNQLKDSEEPDFIVIIENEILGIEITELYRTPINNEPILQEQESLRNQLANKSCEFYEQIESHPIIVTLHFNSTKFLKKKNLENIAKNILDLVLQNEPDIGKNIILKSLNYPKSFPQELNAISIFKYKLIKENFWTVANSGWGHKLTIDEIQNRIDIKNKKIKNYKTKNNCSKLWLLIVSSGYNISTTMDFPDDIKQNLFKSNFDRLFILNDMKEVIELKKESNIRI